MSALWSTAAEAAPWIFGTWVVVALFVLARGGLQLAARLGRVSSVVFACAALAGVLAQLAPELEVGRLGRFGYGSVSYFSASCDVVAGLVAAMLAWPLAGDSPRRTTRRWLSAGWGAFAVSVASRADDMFTLVLALEMAAVVEIWWGSSPRSRRRHFLATTAALLGVTLIYGATSSASLGDLPLGSASIFNHWGSTQRYVGTLADGHGRLPSGIEYQLRGKIIAGMAAVSLFLPGILLLLAGVLFRYWAPGRPMASARIFGRFVAFVLLMRIFAGSLYTPRLVNEPYGWVGPLLALSLGWAAWSLLRLRRARALEDWIGELVRAHLAVVLVVFVVASNLYGHRAKVDRSVAPVLERAWAAVVGDQAIVATLTAFFFAVVLATAARIWLRRHGLRELQDLEGLGRRDPLVGLATAGLLTSLCAWPFGPGFPVFVEVTSSVMSHTEMRGVGLALALIWGVMALFGFDAIRRIFAEGGLATSLHVETEASRVRDGVVATLLVGVLLVAGLVPSLWLHPLRWAGVGFSSTLGGPARERAVREAKERWASDGRLPGASVELMREREGEPPPPEPILQRVPLSNPAE